MPQQWDVKSNSLRELVRSVEMTICSGTRNQARIEACSSCLKCVPINAIQLLLEDCHWMSYLIRQLLQGPLERKVVHHVLDQEQHSRASDLHNFPEPHESPSLLTSNLAGHHIKTAKRNANHKCNPNLRQRTPHPLAILAVASSTRLPHSPPPAQHQPLNQHLSCQVFTPILPLSRSPHPPINLLETQALRLISHQIRENDRQRTRTASNKENLSLQIAVFPSTRYGLQNAIRKLKSQFEAVDMDMPLLRIVSGKASPDTAHPVGPHVDAKKKM